MKASDETPDQSAPLTSPPGSQSGFNTREILWGTALLALWCGYLVQCTPFRGFGLVVVAAAAILGGAMTHLVFTRVVRRRMMAIIVPLLIYSLPTLLLVIVGQSFDFAQSIWFLIEVMASPLVAPFNSTSIRPTDWFAGLTIAIILTPAFLVRQSLPYAIVSAAGVAAWFLTGLAICIQSHFGA